MYIHLCLYYINLTHTHRQTQPTNTNNCLHLLKVSQILTPDPPGIDKKCNLIHRTTQFETENAKRTSSPRRDIPETFQNESKTLD